MRNHSESLAFFLFISGTEDELFANYLLNGNSGLTITYDATYELSENGRYIYDDTDSPMTTNEFEKLFGGSDDEERVWWIYYDDIDIELWIVLAIVIMHKFLNWKCTFIYLWIYLLCLYFVSVFHTINNQYL